MTDDRDPRSEIRHRFDAELDEIKTRHASTSAAWCSRTPGASPRPCSRAGSTWPSR